jgi:hypothetical protein
VVGPLKEAGWHNPAQAKRKRGMGAPSALHRINFTILMGFIFRSLIRYPNLQAQWIWPSRQPLTTPCQIRQHWRGHTDSKCEANFTCTVSA